MQKDCESMFIFYNCIDVVFKSRQKLPMEIESRTMVAGGGWKGEGGWEGFTKKERKELSGVMDMF